MPRYLEDVDIPERSWIALDAVRVGEHFVPGRVITAVGPLVSGDVPDDHRESVLFQDEIDDDGSEGDGGSGGESGPTESEVSDEEVVE